MLPPILEIFVVWHPQDTKGAGLAQTLFNHFMYSPILSSVIGGGIHVSLRSMAWEHMGDAPRPIYTDTNQAPNGIQPAHFTVIVPLLGTELAASVEAENSPWHQFVVAIRDAQVGMQDRHGVFPYLLSNDATHGTRLGQILGEYQLIAPSNSDESDEDIPSLLCRDLTQGIAQMISPNKSERLTAFISHTKRHSHIENEDVDVLVGLVREVIGGTRLNEFFDASDLQPGTDWDGELRTKSATSAMLAVRTDLYSSREWCQREIAIAKTHGMPVIMMDAIGYGEERGSFLMDHVPRVAVRKSQGRWLKRDVYRALNLLVDECLKRALWILQKELTEKQKEWDIAWWAPHAPEPLTLSYWINTYLQERPESERDIRILHPDPPLGPEEREVLLNYARSTKLGNQIDIMTPRQLATRGG